MRDVCNQSLYDTAKKPFSPLRYLRLLPCLQALCERAQVASRHLHRDIFTRFSVKNTLLLNIHLIRPACMAHGMASGIPECCLLASFDALSCHEPQDSRDDLTYRQYHLSSSFGVNRVTLHPDEDLP